MLIRIRNTNAHIRSFVRSFGFSSINLLGDDNVARRHNITLITKTSELNDRDFIIRNIYKNLYWCSYKHWNYLSQFSFVNSFTVKHILLYLYLMFTAAVMGCVWQLVIKENDDDDDNDGDRLW